MSLYIIDVDENGKKGNKNLGVGISNEQFVVMRLNEHCDSKIISVK